MKRRNLYPYITRRLRQPVSSIRMTLVVVALLPATSCARPAITVPSNPALASAPTQSGLDRPIEIIAASPRGRAILDKDFPGLRNHAMYGFFKSMSLHQIAAMSKGRMTPEMMAQAETDLAKLKFAPASARPSGIDDLEPKPIQAARREPG